ncbi:MAG: hypothetical protein GY946_11725 [bacterium]|nr:hypothetical protein [bacterium]
MRRSTGLLATLVLVLDVSASSEGRPDPQVDRHYPTLRLPTIDGKQTIGLFRFAGKKVLLIEFASW